MIDLKLKFHILYCFMSILRTIITAGSCVIFYPCSDRANLAKSVRKSDKKVRELSLQVEEERRHADQYKEQVFI